MPGVRARYAGNIAPYHPAGRPLPVGAASLIALPARADSLADIQKAKKVRIAVAMGIPQYSYIDGSMQPTGSDVETAKLIAKDLGVDAR